MSLHMLTNKHIFAVFSTVEETAKQVLHMQRKDCVIRTGY
jgi:hypothetical protein